MPTYRGPRLASPKNSINNNNIYSSGNYHHVQHQQHNHIHQHPEQQLHFLHQQQQFNQPDSIYWSAIDFESEDSDSTQPATSVSRHYVDPWDLENYIYIRKHMKSAEPSTTTPSPAGEPINSTFYYVPGVGDDEPDHKRSPGTPNNNYQTIRTSPIRNHQFDDCPGCYAVAGLDEQLFYNEKYDRVLNGDGVQEDTTYSTYAADMETSSTERNSSSDSTISTLRLHTPGFGVANGQRSLVLPKPTPHIEFPGPPSYDYYEIPIENSYCSLNECFDCASMGQGGGSDGSGNVHLYATTRRRSRSSNGTLYSSNRFGLSKKGLLQIDYSCNWNNLDKYIANNS